MKKTRRRLLALVLALTMMFPSTSIAAEIEEPVVETMSEETSQEVATPEVVVDETILTGASSTVPTAPEDGTNDEQPFISGTGGSTNFRIPGITTVNYNGNEVIVATADARWDNEKDGGGSDLVVSRSTDGGATWDYTFAGYFGDNGDYYNADSSTLMDPLIISDGTKLYLFADMYPAGYSISSSSTTNTFSDTGIGFDGNGRLLLSADNRSNYGYYLDNGIIYSTAGTAVDGYTVDGWFNLYQDGSYVTNLFFADSPYEVRATSYICMMTSEDGGANWSAPTLLNVKPEGISWMVLGPGKGIITEDDTMMFSAYDDTNVYVIFSKDGGATWNRVSTNAAGNESQLVELRDGTIRMFVKRKGNNTIAYIDFTPSGNTYTVGGLQDTGVANFSNCMISAYKYPELIDGKEAIMVCSPSDSTGGDWSGRYNGKIRVFTLDADNEMSLAYTYQVNESFFAYSNMTMLEDGSIALLYEDGCISYQNAAQGPGYSHITYENLPISTIAPGARIGITGFYESAEEDAASVSKVSFAVNETDAKTVVFKGLGDTQSLVPTSYNEDVISVAVEGSEITITPNAAGATTITFTVQDTTTRAITAGTTYDLPVDVYGVTEVKDVTLYVGTSKTLTDETGDYKDSYTGSGLDTSISTVTVDQVAVDRTTAVSEIQSGRTYLLENIRAAENDIAKAVLTDESYTSSAANWIGTVTGLKVDGSVTDSTELWTITASGSGYTVMQNDKFLSFGDKSAAMTDTEIVLTLTYDSANSRWKIFDGTYYLTDLAGATLDGAFGSTASNDDGNYWRIYPVYSNTAITFTGVTVGRTAVIVGNTQYNIDVVNPPVVKNITIDMGDSYTWVDNSGTYTDADLTSEFNAAIASAAFVNETEPMSTEAATTIESGMQYYIENYRRANSQTAEYTENTLLSNVSGTTNASTNGLVLSGTLDNPGENTLWTITEGTTSGTYAITDSNGNYLAILANKEASVETDKNYMNLVWSDTDSIWGIYQTVSGTNYYLNNFGGEGQARAAGYTETLDNTGTWWNFYRAAYDYTEITFTGVTAGTTSVTIGDVRYNITVTDPTKRDVVLYVGESKTFTDETNYYADGTIDDASVAEMEVDGTAAIMEKDMQAVTSSDSLSDEKQYLIVSERSATEGLLTGTAYTATISWSSLQITGLNTHGTVSADSSDVWNIVATGNNTYYIKYGDKYLTLSYDSSAKQSKAELTDTPTELTLTYENNYWYITLDGIYLSNVGGFVNSYYGASGFNETGGSGWTIYEVVETDVVITPGYTDVTFNGKTVGTTTAVVGNVTYTITVKDSEEGDLEEFTAIVGTQTYTADNGSVNMDGKEITALTTSVRSSFQLGVDIDDADTVIWTSADETIATVDENGLVTGASAGDTTVTAMVIKDGVRESVTIPVHVSPAFNDNEETTRVFYYIEEIIGTDVYYSLYCGNVTEEIVKVQQGQVICFERPTNVPFGLVWISSPDDGYALTYMAATGSNDQYYPLHDGTVTSEGNETLITDDSSYYAGGGTYSPYWNLTNYNIVTAETLNSMLQTAITEEGCDGAMSMMRKADEESLSTSLSFRAQKLPSITKTVMGVLGETGLREDWRVYAPGMTASTGEYVFYKIDVEKYEESEEITYTNVILTDLMAGAILTDGTYEYDYDNEVLDITTLTGAVLDSATNTYYLDMTDIFAADATETGTHTYYVAYQITAADLNTNITNNVELTYGYQSEYSKGSIESASEAEASIMATQFEAKNLVADFGLPAQAYYEAWGEPKVNLKITNQDTGEAAGTATYGRVDVAGNTTDGWTITYTPTSVLKNVDTVTIFSSDGTLEYTFEVYPATSVYYEENFADYTGSWTTAEKSTVNQQSAVQGEAATGKYNYGYDDAYDGVESDTNAEVTASVAQTTVIGDSAEFTFTGTGVDVYADCTAKTGTMLVQVKDSNDVLEKMILVNTKLEAGTADTALGLASVDTAKNVPVVSVAAGTLFYGEHTVTITHVKKSGAELPESYAGIVLDGFRVYGPLTSADGAEIYSADNESNPAYVEMRDQVLATLLTGKDNKEDYYGKYAEQIAENLISQVHSSVDLTGGAIILTSATSGYTEAQLQDFLENSSKNELYLYPDQSLVFKVDDGSNLQLGMRALNAAVSYSVNGEETTIASNVDMYYRITPVQVDETDGEGNVTNTYYLFTITNESETAEGDAPAILSITNLKKNSLSGVTPKLGGLDASNLVPGLLSLGYESEFAAEEPATIRVSGTDRYETAYAVADELKARLSVEQFDAAIVATGKEFADALSGSYLASVKNAPILLTNGKTDNIAKLVTYIKDNVAPGGMVYILGGTDVVPETLNVIEGYTVKRLFGATRYETNIAILDEAGVNGNEIIVATGKDFADSLSASAAGRPILLVKDEITDAQRAVLRKYDGGKIYIVGGTNAVSEKIENALTSHGRVYRIAGDDRYATSVEVAKTFFADATVAVLASAKESPDGLCGGPLAMAMNAPLILTADGKTVKAAAYAQEQGIDSGIVLGGDSRIPNDSVEEIF